MVMNIKEEVVMKVKTKVKAGASYLDSLPKEYQAWLKSAGLS